MKVQMLTITAADVGQRIDNFLLKQLKGVPKARIYRAVRKGEVRVNKKRIKNTYRLQLEDVVRVPPLTVPDPDAPLQIRPELVQEIADLIVYEDDDLLVVNKPPGFAAHKGTKVKLGIIDILKAHYDPEPVFLVHRLDKETSGCLLLAKNRPTLVAIHALMRSHQIAKHYVALLQGNLGAADELLIDAPLVRVESTTPDGAKAAVDQEQGQVARTFFTTKYANDLATLVDVRLETGRMHQIRAHAKYLGHPIAGDRRYGEEYFNNKMKKYGLRRLFLHARRVVFSLGTKQYDIELPLPDDLQQVVQAVFG